MARSLQGMTVLITGASSGIGRALAELLDQRGARLTLVARRADRLDSLNRSLGGRHQVIVADVSVPADCERMVDQAADHHGRLDTVVCNAGYGLAKATADVTADEMTRIFQTNVFGTTDVVRRVVPIMAGQTSRDGFRGQLVIVSSVVARRGLPFAGAYAATKAAQLALSESLRVELKPKSIAVTSIHPAGTETEFFDVADRKGNGTAAPTAKSEIRQTAETVAEAIIKAIAKPRPEVWPLKSVRWGISIGTLLPGMVDKALANYRRPVSKAAENSAGQTRLSEAVPKPE
jgi:short-subunit dehydrogenase